MNAELRISHGDPAVVDALDYLASLRPRARTSLTYLHRLDGALDRLDLFRGFFPDEFATVRANALAVDDETGHTAGELRFVELLKTLFPIDERAEEIEGGFDTVPVDAYHHEPESIYDVEDLKLGWRVGEVLVNFADVGTELVECLPLAPDAFEGLRLVSVNGLDFNRLRALCEAETSPLRLLWTSVRLARRDTDNVFFDGLCMCGECGSSIEWTEENLRFLAEAWESAREFYEAMDEFTRWLDEDHPSRLAAVIEIWNLAERNGETP